MRGGFGLIELMITIAIVAILTAIALPSYQQSIQSNRTATEADDFISAINIARGEATTRSRPITLCPSADGATCSGDTDWTTHRWIAFTDYGVKGTVDGADAVVRVWKAINTQDTLTPAPAVKWISFNRAGNTSVDNAAVTATNNAIFVLKPLSCVANAQVKRAVTLTLLGRASNASCICSATPTCP